MVSGSVQGFVDVLLVSSHRRGIGALLDSF